MEAQFFLCEKDTIGWRPIGSYMTHWPRRLAAFVSESTDEDSGWREWDTPADATFEVVRPGGIRVLLTRDGEISLA